VIVFAHHLPAITKNQPRKYSRDTKQQTKMTVQEARYKKMTSHIWHESPSIHRILQATILKDWAHHSLVLFVPPGSWCQFGEHTQASTLPKSQSSDELALSKA